MQPTHIHYTPGDCALFIGPSDLLLKRLELLRVAGLRPALLCTDLPDLENLPRGLRALSGRLAGVSGWMGMFTASLQSASGPVDLAPLSFHDDGHFDWVIDFSGAPAPGKGAAPLGHYALPPDDFPALKRSLLEIATRLREGHDKPRYFQFDAEKCAHRRQSVAGCSTCQAVCAADAIGSDGEVARIEPYLCQGCGACALVCPSGAVRHVLPGSDTQLARLGATLEPGSSGLWITDDATDAADGWLPWPLPETASLGLEFWLAALALGGKRVVIAAKRSSELSHAALAGQIELGRALLAGLGLPPALGWAESAEALVALPPLAPFTPPVGDGKRTLLCAALDHLAAHAPAPPVSIELPTAAPLGEVEVDARLCTLCAACVRICPANALSLPGSVSQLAFTESRCLQCGLCVNVCPEKVVRLKPRYLVTKTAREAPRVIAEAEMVACAGCGMPYTTRTMLARTQAMMAGHPMFQGEQAGLMSLCPDCRQKAMAGVPM
ncbi:MAG: 4Fe-4S binding protein [Pseudomonadota bacterium]|nr:4Fe-4S binding protein [Pseudomonadota bacterium]